jgi:hypothetical protein
VRSNTVEIDVSQRPSGLRFAPNFNVAVAFIDRHISEGRSAKVAIRTADSAVTYADLAANVDRCADGLTRLGLRRGERLLMVVKDCPAFFYLFWGAIKAGIVPVPLNTLLRSSSYAFMIDDSSAAALFYSPEFASEVEPAIAGATRLPRYVLCTEGKAPSLATLLAESEPKFEAVPATADCDCFWLYSSGSAGAPKGAVHRHRDMVVSSQRFGVETLGVRDDDVLYSETKLFFAFGLGNNLTFPLWVGATAVLNEQRPARRPAFHSSNDTGRRSISACQHFMLPTCNILRERNRIFLRSDTAYPQVKRFRQRFFGAGTRKPVSGFWMVSVRPKRCTFSYRTRLRTSGPDRAVASCPDIAPASLMSMAMKSPTGRAGNCLSPVAQRHAIIGTMPNAPRRQWSMVGSTKTWGGMQWQWQQ